MSDVLVHELMQIGWSRATALEMVREAQETVEARRRQKALADTIAAIPYNEWLRSRFPSMIWDKPFHRMICDHIDMVLNGDLVKLMISLPPRAGKSEMATMRLPVRFLEQNPTGRVIVGAYNRDLAKTFTSRSLAFYRSAHPKDIKKEAEDEWENKSGGGVLAVGVGSGVTGKGADLLILDDPVKGYEEAVSPTMQEKTWQWWLNDFSTRRNQLERTPTIVIATRWDRNDLMGKILTASGGDEWKVISFPAIAKENDLLGRVPGESLWPERMPVAELKAIEETMGPRYKSLYDQDPVPAKGILFELAWLRAESYPPPGEPMATVRFWDLAESAVSQKNLKPDYTAGVKMTAYMMENGLVSYYIEDVARIRCDPGARDHFILTVAKSDRELGCDLQVFEETSKSEIATLRSTLALDDIQVDSMRSTKNKVARSTNLRAAFSQGHVTYRARMANEVDFISECLAFPGGENDDMVDAATGAHTWLVVHSLVLKRR